METKTLEEITKKKKEITSFATIVVCPKCGIKQFSPFDKMYTFICEQCYICAPYDEEKDKLIFSILEK